MLSTVLYLQSWHKSRKSYETELQVKSFDYKEADFQLLMQTFLHRNLNAMGI